MEIIKLSEPKKENKITNIKAAVRNENRVNIFINGEFSFSLDISQLIDYKLKIGESLSEEKIAEIKRASTFGKVYARTLEWVLTRPRSIKETQDYLKLKIYKNKIEDFTDEDINEIIKKLVNKKYLDDEKFAEYYVENKNIKKGISDKKLKYELRKKGINDEIIKRTLEKSERNPEEEIKKIILKKGNKYSPEKLFNYIVRQGFSYELAKKEVEEFFKT